jgi:hypothetical protein
MVGLDTGGSAMQWCIVSGFVPSQVQYEAAPEDGVRLRIEPTRVDEWPAFRWSVDIKIAGHQIHHDELAVDLLSAKHAAENYTLQQIATRHQP